MGIAQIGKKTSGPPMKPINIRKIIKNGRSMQANRLDELKNSLSCSNSRRLLTKAPVESGFASRRIERTFSTSELDKTTSAFLPATSTK